MENYLSHLLSDIETAILQRWQVSPPHNYQMGMPERYLEPPAGWDGPPFGYGRDDLSIDDFFAELKNTDVLSDPLPVDETTAENLDELMETDEEEGPAFEASLNEMDEYIEGKASLTMFDHFGFEPEQFPPADSMKDHQLDKLTHAVCRLWTAFNFTPVFPQHAPGRIVYPLLLERMGQPSCIFEHGILGVEFCEYEPKECRFGEWCGCKSYIKDDGNEEF